MVKISRPVSQAVPTKVLYESRHPKPHLRSENDDVARARAAVVLSHDVQIQREMFVEGVIGPDRKSVPHPVMLAPVVEDFVSDIPREIRFLNHKRMFDLAANAIAPGIDLRLAPAALEPVAFHQRELASRKTQSSAQSKPVFIFTLAMRRLSFAMKVKWIET